MYKLVVSAFDGVLIDKEEAIPVSTMLELENVRKKSLFCIATGRDLNTILEYNRSFSFLDYIICYNGAVVYDCLKRKTIFKKTLGVRIVKKINKLFDNYCIKYLYMDMDVYMIEVHGSEEDMKKIVASLVLNEVNVSYVVRSINGKWFVEIVSKDISKFSGVEVICKKKHLSLKDVLAIGYDDNDYELIKNVGYGVAMGNSSDFLKKYAKKVTLTNNEKGVEKVLREMF